MVDTSNYKLGFSDEELETLGATNTAREICQQPEVWKATYQRIVTEEPRISDFLKLVYAYKNLKIILTGAGTSAYIGDILSQSFQRLTGKPTWAFATTDLVTHPRQYFDAKDVVLLVSFARSGNSPESVAVVQLAESVCRQVYHLVITCNVDGELAKTVRPENGCLVVLPNETNDKALAMTSSFTSMLLAGLLIARIGHLADCRQQVDRVALYAEQLLANQAGKLRAVAQQKFERALFLGAGPLRGAARESQLKLQELTGGKVICKFDSFLGVRHGPKVVIDNKTLVFFIFSNDRYAHQYEIDLVESVNVSNAGLYRIGIGEKAEMTVGLDWYLALSPDGDPLLDDEFIAVISVLPAQIIGLMKAIDLGLPPDSPSADGAISRVVQGVSIYPFENGATLANGHA